ncbi:DUF3618 domain-containing protein [Streptomyces sp. NPDC058401]
MHISTRRASRGASPAHRRTTTRDELGQTVEALAAKADIKARTKEKTTP